MDRRGFVRALGIIGAGAAVSSCIPKEYVLRALEDGLYDWNDNLVGNYDRLLGNVVSVYTSSSIQYGDTKPVELGGRCSGIRYKDKIITANHCFPFEKHMMVSYGQSEEYDGRVKNGVSVCVGEELEDAEIIYNDRENDLVVVGVPGICGGGDYIPFGDSDELRVGHHIALVGMPLAPVKEVRKGSVVSLEGYESFLTSHIIDPQNVFLTWGIGLPGDSGGAVYAFRDGNPEVVGMYKSSNQMICENHKINHIRGVLRDYI